MAGKTATILSSCECQARLGARLDERRVVISGWAIDRPRGVRSTAPAQSIRPGADRFGVGWLCPLCGRNVLRSFEAGGLVWENSADPAPETAA